jgi:hypothetical protein
MDNSWEGIDKVPASAAYPRSQDNERVRTVTVRDPYSGRPITLVIAGGTDAEEEQDERVPQVSTGAMRHEGVQPSRPQQRSSCAPATATHAQQTSRPTAAVAGFVPSAETQAHPLYQFLQSKLSPYQLPEHEIHNAYSALMDEAIPSASLLQAVPRDQFHETISSRNLKRGVEVALRKVHDDLLRQEDAPARALPASYASVAALSPAHGVSGDRIEALEQRLAGLEDKINTLTALLLSKQGL